MRSILEVRSAVAEKVKKRGSKATEKMRSILEVRSAVAGKKKWVIEICI